METRSSAEALSAEELLAEERWPNEFSAEERSSVETRSLEALSQEIVACRRCPRLSAYTRKIGEVKRRAYQDWEYWARPVPSFGDPKARLLIVGLAPAAHGANRTGRMFTGDSSGDWLFRALHKAGFANQPESVRVDDGLKLTDAYITAVCHCAPPDNKPTREEIENCTLFLAQELRLMTRVRAIVCLGRIAFDQVLRLMRQAGHGWPRPLETGEGTLSARRPPETAPAKRPEFRHGQIYRWAPKRLVDGRRGDEDRSESDLKPRRETPLEPRLEPSFGELPALIASYHPSRQNTNTGVLTEAMFDEVFRAARTLIGAERTR